MITNFVAAGLLSLGSAAALLRFGPRFRGVRFLVWTVAFANASCCRQYPPNVSAGGRSARNLYGPRTGEPNDFGVDEK